MREMKFYGIQKLTLLDYPGQTACTLFTGGCNFRCPFCHNGTLVCDPGEPLDTGELEEFLQKRRGKLDGVCITGGEPLLHPQLPDFLAYLKELGYLVKLDTNGSCPDRLEAILSAKLADYVAMDIKAAPEHYPRVTGLAQVDVGAVLRSADLLMARDTDYEFRTTAVKGLHTAADFEAMGRRLAGAKQWFLQNYQETENVLQPGWESFSVEELETFAALLRQYVPRVELRGAA